MSETPRFDRRTVLATTAAVAGTALAGCSGGSSTPEDDSGDDSTPTDDSGGDTPSFDGWLENVDNYDGVVDETGADEVALTVGAEANGGAFGFGPAAVRVSTGTTVVWEWSGEGGGHDVVDDDGAFESETYTEEGETFEYTFEESGTTKYYCTPHKAMGMKGVVVVE